MSAKMDAELERYASATHDVGHDIVATCLMDDAASDSGRVIVRIAEAGNTAAVFRNAVAQLAGNNLHCLNYWGTTTVPNKAIARLMESLSECGEKGIAFLIASRPLAPGVAMTTHMCWVNQSAKKLSVHDVMGRLMLEWPKLRQ